MEQALELVSKHGLSIVLNIWFMVRLEKVLMKNYETNLKVLAVLEAKEKADN